MVQVLVDAGADLNAVSASGHSPLTACLSRGHRFCSRVEDILTYLLDQGSELRVRAVDLRVAVANLTNEVFSRLLDHDKTLTITQSLIEDIIINEGGVLYGNLRLLFDKACDIRVTQEMHQSVKDSLSLGLLLSHEPRCAATSDLFELRSSQLSARPGAPETRPGRDAHSAGGASVPRIKQDLPPVAIT